MRWIRTIDMILYVYAIACIIAYPALGSLIFGVAVSAVIASTWDLEKRLDEYHE